VAAPTFAQILARRWFTVLVCVLAGLAASVVVTLRTPHVYKAHAELILVSANDQGAQNAYQGSLFTQQRVQSYAGLASGRAVTEAVVARLHLPETPAALAGHITASVPLNTTLIELSATDRSPRQARDIVNAVSAQFAIVVENIDSISASHVRPIAVKTVTPADLPTAPVSPRRSLNLALGLIAGLALGLTIAGRREAHDTTIRSPDQVGAAADAPLLGVVRSERRTGRVPFLRSASSSPMFEDYRRLRTTLQFADPVGLPRSLVLTSAVGGEGTTTTACLLAVALAQAGTSVALVDANVRHPKVAAYMGLPDDAGLTNVLAGQLTAAEAMRQSHDGAAHVLTSGRLTRNPAELLQSTELASVISALTDCYDVVLIDAAPMLPVADGAITAMAADATLLVARRGVSRQEQVASASSQIRAVNGHLLGVVLLQKKLGRPGVLTAAVVTTRRDSVRSIVRKESHVADERVRRLDRDRLRQRPSSEIGG
jgi:polysaccharide biosynthesis transport protein